MRVLELVVQHALVQQLLDGLANVQIVLAVVAQPAATVVDQIVHIHVEIVVLIPVEALAQPDVKTHVVQHAALIARKVVEVIVLQRVEHLVQLTVGPLVPLIVDLIVLKHADLIAKAVVQQVVQPPVVAVVLAVALIAKAYVLDVVVPVVRMIAKVDVAVDVLMFALQHARAVVLMDVQALATVAVPKPAQMRV